MTTDGPPPRHLHPVDPPFDPEYDTPHRTPPHNLAAEQAVLGALILSPHLAPDLALELDGTDFYRPHHETIWDACHRLINTGTPLDPITLAAQLTKTGDLVKVGGPIYLLELTQACPTPANAAYYAAEVRDTARLRAVQQTGTRLLQLAAKADPTAVDAGLAEALQVVDDTVLRFGAKTGNANPTGLADLSWILTGVAPTSPPPVYVQRTDATALFYTGRVNGVFGDPECGKTWLAQVAIIEALAAGGTAAMIDVDHNGQDHTSARLALLGARFEHIADPDRFRYYEPDDADQLRAAITDITTRAPDVVVLDSIGEMLPMLGVKSIDNDEITAALRTIAMPPAKAGSCVITIDHLPKSAEARGTGYAIGGTAKKRAIDGAYLRAEARTQPTPGGIGRITLRIEKDRTGELRKASGGGYAGTFTIDSTQAHVTTWTVGNEDSPITADGHFRPTHLMEAVSRYVEQNDQVLWKDIKGAIGGKDNNLRAAIQCLINDGFMSTLPGPRNSTKHHAIAMYREAEDDNK